MPLRALEAALLEVCQSSDVTKVDIVVLDQAAEMIREYTDSDTARYDSGRRLKDIAGFISDKKLCKKTTWQSPFPAIKRANSRLDNQSKNVTKNKLPSQAALDALAEMFANNPQDTSDKVVLAYCGLMLCAPSRISELSDLHKHCIHIDTDTNGKEQLGLRWHAKKKGGSDIKYVPSAMQDVAREAIGRLTNELEKARDLAKWLEDTNGKFYRPKNMREIPDDKPLTRHQIATLFNSESNSLATRTINEFSRVLIKNRHKAYNLHNRIVEQGCITFRDLDDLSRSLLPNEFPYINKKIGLKYSDALIAIRVNELDSKATRCYQLAESNIGKLVANRLTSIPKRKSIFEKYGYTEPNGTLVCVTSHQFRHWLNTLAQKGNVGQIDIAKWSGRANVHQNSVYNHMTHQDYIDDLKSSGLQVASNLAALAKIKTKDPNMPVTLTDLDAQTSDNDKVAHVTEWGFCVHDFAVSPCQSFADCLNCTEQVCVKGDDEKLERLKRQRQLLSAQLKKAIDAAEEELFNADRWVTHQALTIERIDGLISVLESSDIAEGSVIRLSNEFQDSPIKRELGREVNENLVTPEPVSLNEMRKLLVGN